MHRQILREVIMKDNKRGLRRQRTRRIVQRRLRIIKDAWVERCDYFENKPGRLRKYNLSCGCWMCKEGRKSNRPKDPAIEEEHDNGTQDALRLLVKT